MTSRLLKANLAALVVWLTLLGVVGCTGGSGAKPTYEGWKASIQSHADTRGDGDINSLRSSDSQSGQIAFNVIGSEQPDKSNDVNSILLGRRSILGTDWYVFIVGIVKAGDVQDIRVAAARNGTPALVWQFGIEDRASTSTYRTAKLRSRMRGDSAVIGFPLEEDQFSIETAGSLITVVERQSGARWTLGLN